MKTYLGDGVYVTVDDYDIELTTENGIETTNKIYLDAEVWAELVRVVEKVRGEG